MTASLFDNTGPMFQIVDRELDDLALQRRMDEIYNLPEHRAYRIHEKLVEECNVRAVMMHCENRLEEAKERMRRFALSREVDIHWS